MKKHAEFFGREDLIAQMGNRWAKRVPSLVTCRGRRRVGKSTLIAEFARRSDAVVNGESLILEKDFSFKGHSVENYVLQQIAGKTEGNVHYWAERAESEIDFVIQQDGEAVPIEVKAGTDRKCAAFKSFVNNRHPRHAIRFSALNLKRDGAFVNIPLYLAPRYSACL